jgi:uncharacterized protein YlxP (DUF503 family)
LLECTGRVYGSTSLKEKRRVLKSSLMRIQSQLNLSVAEVDYQDHRQMVKVAMVGVSSSKGVVEKELQKARNILEQNVELEILASEITFL